MLHLKLTPRSIRRLCVTMALIAPIVYLFGSLFTALNGAHGAFPFSQENEVVTRVDSYRVVQTARNGNFVTTSWFAVNGGTMEVSNNVGFFSFPSTTADKRISYSSRMELGHTYYLSFEYVSDVSYKFQGIYQSVTLPASNAFVKHSELATFSNASFITDYWYFYNSSGTSWALSLANFMIFDLTVMYGLGNEPVIADFEAVFTESYYSLGDYYIDVPVYGVPDNSQYVFNQFFASDNFISQIGSDAISETPHGFAPFGALFRWLDLNVFNIGNTQVGLMAYGYLYWCAHVLVFDLVFMCATFFISFVDSCFTQFNRSE